MRQNSDPVLEGSNNWVFAYGSLMWNPGFEYELAKPALLRGAHRSLCIYSHVYRGTPERPGLVLGLDHGGACRGMAFKVTDKNWQPVVEYLRERELVNNVYREVTRSVQLLGEQEETVPALTYIARRGHEQHAGKLPFEEILRLVRQGAGKGGPNIDYLRNTLESLNALNVDDGYLAKVLKAL